MTLSAVDPHVTTATIAAAHLRRGLHDIYDGVLNERLPEPWAELVRRLDRTVRAENAVCLPTLCAPDMLDRLAVPGVARRKGFQTSR